MKRRQSWRLTWHAIHAIFTLKVPSDADLPRAIIRVGESSLVGIHVLKVIDGPLNLLAFEMGGRDPNTAEDAEVLLEVRIPPIAAGLLEARHELLWVAVEDLTDSSGELLSAPEGAIGDVDVDGQRLLEIVIKDRAERSEDALEGLYTTAKVEALLTTLEERLLDLRVLLGGPLAHDVIEEVDGVDALV